MDYLLKAVNQLLLQLNDLLLLAGLLLLQAQHPFHVLLRHYVATVLHLHCIQAGFQLLRECAVVLRLRYLESA